MLDESGYTAMLQADRSAESAGRLENLAELTRAMEEYETLGAFLEHVSLVMDNDEARQGERVTIMTIHAAKGLEFDIVYPRRLGGRRLPLAARDGRRRPRQPRGGAPARLCRDHPRAAPMHHPPRRQPPHLRPMDQLDPLPLPRRIARGRISSEETTMTGGESLWRAQWSERADPFAHVARPSRGPGCAARGCSAPLPRREGDSRPARAG